MTDDTRRLVERLVQLRISLDNWRRSTEFTRTCKNAVDAGDQMALRDAAILLDHFDQVARSLEALATPSPANPPCAKCGGLHLFDTSIPSHQWNRVIRAAGLPDYLCMACIVAAFVKAGARGFTAELYGSSDGCYDPLSEDASGFDLHGESIEVRIGGAELDTVRELRDENNRLRSELGRVDHGNAVLTELQRAPSPEPREAVRVLEEIAGPSWIRLRTMFLGGPGMTVTFDPESASPQLIEAQKLVARLDAALHAQDESRADSD